MLNLLGRRAGASLVYYNVTNFWRVSNNAVNVYSYRTSDADLVNQRFHSNHSKNANIKFARSNRKSTEDADSLQTAANDPDVFGTISKATGAEYYDNEYTDDGDAKEDEHHRNIPFKSKRLPVKQYEIMIERFIRDSCLKEAIDVLEVRMPADRVKPENYTYQLLIMECGRVGYTKKAFQLYNKMKQRDLEIISPVYAALFNACANSARPSRALELARNLRKQMIQKGIDANRIIYNNMIKAFGRCNDLKTAFELVDEMKDKHMELHIDTPNHLLQACIADRDYGFRNGLLVWHSIFQHRLTPDIASFNLLLRCARDCGIGDLAIAQQAIGRILSDSHGRAQISHSRGHLLITDGNDVRETDQLPNLVSKTPHLGSLVQMDNIGTMGDRLFLLGGCDAVMAEFERHKVRPNVKTFTQLLDMIPASQTAEFELIEKMRYMRVRTDTDFFNMLMKRRVERKDFDGAKVSKYPLKCILLRFFLLFSSFHLSILCINFQNVLQLMRKVNLDPDIATYGILAMLCRDYEQMKDYLNMLQEKNIRYLSKNKLKKTLSSGIV